MSERRDVKDAGKCDNVEGHSHTECYQYGGPPHEIEQVEAYERSPTLTN
jgi:hypothetical protein